MSRQLGIQIDHPATGPENMEKDLRLLEQAEESRGDFSLVRFYRWHPATVSVGRNQEMERAIDLDFCTRNAVPVVRRPTGGRAVFHDQELTYAVISNCWPSSVEGGIEGSYRTVAAVLGTGLEALGVSVQMAQGVPGAALRPRGGGQPPCFVTPSRWELTCQGRKIVGSAQSRLRRAALQHGSIPLEIDYGRMANVLGTEEGNLRSRVISLSEAAGRRVDFHELVDALTLSFLGFFQKSSREPQAEVGGLAGLRDAGKRGRAALREQDGAHAPLSDRGLFRRRFK